MNSIQTIPLLNLLWAFVPVVIVIGLLWHWSTQAGTALYAVLRMLVQLMLIGYALVWIFGAERPVVISAVVVAMMLAAAWIALNPLKDRRRAMYARTVLALAAGCLTTLVFVLLAVLDLAPWYEARYAIPLGGMVLANAMTTISLAGERLGAESARGVPFPEARKRALQTSLIPNLNSLFAVGLVSLPGTMTGQIISGVSPLIATRYQILIMCMIFGSAGISVICYLLMMRPGDFGTANT